MKDQFYLCYSSLVSANLIDGGMLRVGQCPWFLRQPWTGQVWEWLAGLEGRSGRTLFAGNFFFLSLQSFEMALGMRLRGVWVGRDPV